MKMFSVIAVAAFCLAGAVGAADKPQGDASAQDQSQIGWMGEANGKVTSVHSVDLVGGNEKHTLIKLLGDDGETDIIDLGSTEDLKKNAMEPAEGQTLWVQGRIGKLNEKVMLVAETVSQAKMLRVERTSGLRQETQKHADKRGATDTNETATAPAGDANRDISSKKETIDAGMQSRTVDGTVVHCRTIKIEGQAEEHQLVKLQTEGGIVVLDLGLVSKVPTTVDLSAGKSIAASGTVGKLNDRPLIITDSIGNLTDIVWPAAAVPEKK